MSKARAHAGLTKRERQIMDVLYRLGRATAAVGLDEQVAIERLKVPAVGSTCENSSPSSRSPERNARSRAVTVWVTPASWCSHLTFWPALALTVLGTKAKPVRGGRRFPFANLPGQGARCWSP